ncbi:MAG: magnesium transporter [Gemmatimonadales bacterium]
MESTEHLSMSLEELRAAWPILSPEERLEAFEQLGTEHANELFTILDSVDQAEFLLSSPADRRTRFLGLLPPDDLTDVFQELEEGVRRDVFRSLTPEDLAEVQSLARYEEDEAGGLMTPDFAHVLPHMTVDEAIVALRRQLRERPETLRYVYVLESDAQLVGVVSFRVLFGARAGESVRQLMHSELLTVLEDTDQEEVASLMNHHGLSALPVVDTAGRMKGIITSDDVIEVMEEEATEDIHKLAAVAPADIDYARASIGLLWRRRVGWLLILLVTGFLTSSVMEHFEATLSAMVILVFFVPLVTGAGGNTGTQSAMLIIRSLSTGELRTRDWGRVIAKELAVGLLLGLLLAVAIGIRGYFVQDGGLRIALVLATTMVAVVLWANLVGAVLPVLLRAVKLDPAVVSAPLVSTLVDATGLVIYFTIAGLLLNL